MKCDLKDKELQMLALNISCHMFVIVFNLEEKTFFEKKDFSFLRDA